jgi:hypothetical protein
MKKFNFDVSKAINDFIKDEDNFAINLYALTTLINAYIKNDFLQQFTINEIGYNHSPVYCDRYFYIILSNGIEIYSISPFDVAYMYNDGFFNTIDELIVFIG